MDLQFILTSEGKLWLFDPLALRHRTDHRVDAEDDVKPTDSAAMLIEIALATLTLQQLAQEERSSQRPAVPKAEHGKQCPSHFYPSKNFSCEADKKFRRDLRDFLGLQPAGLSCTELSRSKPLRWLHSHKNLLALPGHACSNHSNLEKQIARCSTDNATRAPQDCVFYLFGTPLVGRVLDAVELVGSDKKGSLNNRICNENQPKATLCLHQDVLSTMESYLVSGF